MNHYSTIATAIVPALLSFIASYLIFKITLAKHKSAIMPELAVKKLLRHKGYTDRTFKAISEALGGWDDNPNELRKILVRSGAIRVNRNDKNGAEEECWYLLDRESERIEKLRTKHKLVPKNNCDKC